MLCAGGKLCQIPLPRTCRRSPLGFNPSRLDIFKARLYIRWFYLGGTGHYLCLLIILVRPADLLLLWLNVAFFCLAVLAPLAGQGIKARNPARLIGPQSEDAGQKQYPAKAGYHPIPHRCTPFFNHIGGGCSSTPKRLRLAAQGCRALASASLGFAIQCRASKPSIPPHHARSQQRLQPAPPHIAAAGFHGDPLTLSPAPKPTHSPHGSPKGKPWPRLFPKTGCTLRTMPVPERRLTSSANRESPSATQCPPTAPPEAPRLLLFSFVPSARSPASRSQRK